MRLTRKKIEMLFDYLDTNETAAEFFGRLQKAAAVLVIVFMVLCCYLAVWILGNPCQCGI
jgi:quinol-cytochrome oxidoreductase complex cytochrome b subunit